MWNSCQWIGARQWLAPGTPVPSTTSLQLACHDWATIWQKKWQWSKFQFLISGLEIRGCQGSLEIFCGSLKFLQGAQRYTGFYAQHLQVAFKDAIRLPWKNLISSPESGELFGRCLSCTHRRLGVVSQLLLYWMRNWLSADSARWGVQIGHGTYRPCTQISSGLRRILTFLVLSVSAYI